MMVSLEMLFFFLIRSSMSESIFNMMGFLMNCAAMIFEKESISLLNAILKISNFDSNKFFSLEVKNDISG
jgi:hypothetical protein